MTNKTAVDLDELEIALQSTNRYKQDKDDQMIIDAAQAYLSEKRSEWTGGLNEKMPFSEPTGDIAFTEEQKNEFGKVEDLLASGHLNQLDTSGCQICSGNG